MNDLTVIVTIRNRRNTLPRVMNYYKDFPADVIFLDSTQEGIYEDRHLAAPNKYEYVPGKNYVQKINDCLKGIKTKYSVVVCDDDFLSKTCIESCLSFLDNNNEYVACRGQEVCLNNVYMSYETLDYLVDASGSFSSNSARDRVCRAWNYFNGANVHNIVRTEVQIKIQEFHLQNPQFNAINIYDKTLSYVAAVHGNMAVLPVFYIVRSNEFLNAPSLKLRSSSKDDISDWKPEVKFKDHFLDLDTTTLEDLVKEDRKFIEVLFKNLCTNNFKEKRFLELLDNELLPKEKNIRGYIRLVNHQDDNEPDVCLPYTTEQLIEGYPLVPRIGAANDLFLNLNNSYLEKFRNGHSADKLYPILKNENLEDLKHILKYVKMFPL